MEFMVILGKNHGVNLKDLMLLAQDWLIYG